MLYFWGCQRGWPKNKILLAFKFLFKPKSVLKIEDLVLKFELKFFSNIVSKYTLSVANSNIYFYINKTDNFLVFGFGYIINFKQIICNAFRYHNKRVKPKFGLFLKN